MGLDFNGTVDFNTRLDVLDIHSMVKIDGVKNKPSASFRRLGHEKREKDKCQKESLRIQSVLIHYTIYTYA